MTTAKLTSIDNILAVGIPVIGMLDATALVNIGETGIPLAWGLIPVLFVRLLVDWSAVTQLWSVDVVLRSWTFLLCGLILLLWFGGAVHAFDGQASPQAQLFQCAARSVMPLFLVASLIFVRIAKRERTVLRTLVIFGIIYIIYGFYDLGGQVLGWPRFLDFVRNSHSVAVVEIIGGWTGTPRIASLASEPSTTTIPIMVIGASMIIGIGRFWSRFSALTACTLFVVGTASRSLWLTVAGALAGAFLLRIWQYVVNADTRSRWDTPLLVAGSFVTPIVLLATRLGLPATDISIQERQDSTRVGYELFLANPIFGSGFGSFETTYRNYADHLSSYTQQIPAIHNGLATYIGNLGLIGFVISIVPLVMIIRLEHLALSWRLYWIIVIVVSAQNFDLSYFPSFWIMMLLAATQTLAVKVASV